MASQCPRALNCLHLTATIGANRMTPMTLMESMRRNGSLVMAIVLVLCPIAVAIGQEEAETLTNSDIVTLTEAGLSPSAIIAVIETGQTDFNTTVAQLAEMSRVGVDSTVLEAMTRASAAEPTDPPTPQPVPGQTAAPPLTLRAGDTFSDALSSGGQGPEMVVIPAGQFRMGCASGRNCYEWQRPIHDVTISKAFAVSKYEVTFEDYDRFSYPNGADDVGWGRGSRPVIHVSWTDAQEYVTWLSLQTGQHYRLLSEAEWEYVARAGSTAAYSWGNAIGNGRANCSDWKSVNQGTCDDQWAYTAPVGSFEANDFGVYDMHGNVAEWVEDCWNDSYDGAPSDGSPWLAGDCRRRVSRSGSWQLSPRLVRSTSRSRNTIGSRLDSRGFRVARTISP